MTQPFEWDTTHDRPLIRVDSDKAQDGIEIRAFGADDEIANTMFAIFAGGERILTRHPEPLLVRFVGDIIESEAFTLVVGDGSTYGVELDDDQRERLERVHGELDEGLKDAPLGGS